MAHIRQSRPDSGLGFQVKVGVVPSSLGLGFWVERLTSVFKAHRLLYHSTLGLRVINKERRG